MSNFMKLVQNENMKIYRRIRTWIMFGILILMVLFFSILFLLGGGGSTTTAWDAAGQLSFLFYMVTIFASIVAADIVAGEFTWGTIKLLLVRPWTRTKVLASKLLALLLFTLIITTLFFASTLLVSFAMYPVKTLMMFSDHASPFAYLLEDLLYRYIDLLVITLFSFMISTVFRSNGIAIGLSMFILFTGGIFTMLFNPVRYPWAKYTLFINMDLSQYRGGQEGVAGMTLGFSVTVLISYVLLFLLISWFMFKKRDVAA
ncbi:ABC transporter permease [Paenibacillus sp. D2_2]|uniref:ABC transporter permease n=1 Tax=Paenibacillus sp. D2_2 TaxID=3073092 RepID=UPI0028162F0E|nr:ABC transporter permease [Paenibacillus sp. D2_2]WMT42099.1 ABC transporter permease [Paenibacillus sp. D2_2]